MSDFNPRSPCGERLDNGHYQTPDDGFQSTLPVRGATVDGQYYTIDQDISIHAPRAGSDISVTLTHMKSSYFNPRSPCGERLPPLMMADQRRIFQSTLPVRGATPPVSFSQASAQFQSTLPVRGATASRPNTLTAREYFNPRSPCGERRGRCNRDTGAFSISIHAPRAGSDIVRANGMTKAAIFQSTLPVRGATAGSASTTTIASNFNPRSPCGERLFPLQCLTAIWAISIHAPRAGSDLRTASPDSAKS